MAPSGRGGGRQSGSRRASWPRTRAAGTGQTGTAGVARDGALQVLEGRRVAAHLEVDLAAQVGDRILEGVGLDRKASEQLVGHIRPPEEQRDPGQPRRRAEGDVSVTVERDRERPGAIAGLEKRHHPDRRGDRVIPTAAERQARDGAQGPEDEATDAQRQAQGLPGCRSTTIGNEPA